MRSFKEETIAQISQVLASHNMYLSALAKEFLHSQKYLRKVPSCTFPRRLSGATKRTPGVSWTLKTLIIITLQIIEDV